MTKKIESSGLSEEQFMALFDSMNDHQKRFVTKIIEDAVNDEDEEATLERVNRLIEEIKNNNKR